MSIVSEFFVDKNTSTVLQERKGDKTKVRKKQSDTPIKANLTVFQISINLNFKNYSLK